MKHLPAMFLAFLALFPSARGGDSVPRVHPVLEQLLSDPAEDAPRQPSFEAPAERAAPPARNELYPEIRVRVTSPRHTVLSTQIAGRVDAVSVRDGDRFQPGDVLVAIDPTFEKIQLAKAEANLKRQELLLEMTDELVQLGSKGELELELVRADLRQASAEVDFMRARLERARVAADFAGRVGDVFVRELQTVADGQPLLEIINDAAMELEFIVPSRWIRWLKPGFPFAVVIDETGDIHRAEVERLGGKVDPLSNSIKVYARLMDAAPELMEGMSGEARIAVPDAEKR